MEFIMIIKYFNKVCIYVCGFIGVFINFYWLYVLCYWVICRGYDIFLINVIILLFLFIEMEFFREIILFCGLFWYLYFFCKYKFSDEGGIKYVFIYIDSKIKEFVLDFLYCSNLND